METKTLELIKSSNSYKLIISYTTEKKIRFLCEKIHNTEWSGVLFYKTEGSFENKDLVIKCIDIFQMDEGNAVYTSYYMSPDVAKYIVDHPELMGEDVYIGLLHSHHSMATSPSGTDLNTLRSEGNDVNHFVSLIVNNAGTYTAMVTRKVKTTQKIEECVTYSTWGDKQVTSTNPYTKESEYIEYSNLNIEIEGNSNPLFKEMQERMMEIKKNKVTDSIPKQSYFRFNEESKDSFPWKEDINTIPVYKSPAVNPVKPSKYYEERGTDYSLDIDSKIIDWIIKQSVTCSAILQSNSSIDVDRWINSMNNLYNKRFHDTETFEQFAINFADFLIESAKNALPLKPEELHEADYSSEIAEIVISELEKYKTKHKDNFWLERWIDIYYNFIL